MEILIGLGVFLFTLLVIHQGYFFVKKIYKPEQRKVQRRLITPRSKWSISQCSARR